MADISPKVNANLEESTRLFKELINTSEEARVKFEEFTESFNDNSIDKFIDRQKLAGVAITAAKGAMAAMQAQQDAYGQEIERLLKAGLSPESEAIKRLASEQQSLENNIEEATNKQKVQADVMEIVEKVANNFFSAMKTGIEKTIELVQKTADVMGAMAADFSSAMETGIEKTTELAQETADAMGAMAAMQAQQAACGQEIERLLKAGLSPEIKAVKSLADEQQNLENNTETTTNKQKAQTEEMEKAGKIADALFNAMRTGIEKTIELAQETAEMGDHYAKTSRSIGMTAETLQELEYAAKMKGVDNLEGSLRNLNKSVTSVKNGAGDLTTALKNTNPELLSQIKNAESNEQAFSLMMDAISKAPDEFTRAQLATAAFGNAGHEMILMAESGTEGLAELREEARKYGVISNESAVNSEKYMDAQDRLKTALTGVQTELTGKLLPAFTTIIAKVADFIAGIDNWKPILIAAGVALGVVTIGLAALMIVTKVIPAMQALAAAFKVLNTVMAKNPFILIAIAIVAVIAALIALYKNWDTVKTYIDQGVARLEYAFSWFASQAKEKFITAVNSIKIGFLSLAEIIVTKVLGTVGNLLDVLSRLGLPFDGAAAAVRGFSQSFSEATQEAKNVSAAAIQAAEDERAETQKTLDAKLAGIDAESAARRADIEKQEKEAKEAADAEINGKNAVEDEKTRIASNGAAARNEIEKDALQERLNNIALTAQQEENLQQEAQNQRIEAVRQFLEQRAEMESEDYAKQIEYLQNNSALFLAVAEGNAEAEEAIAQATEKQIEDIQKKKADAERQLLEERLGAFLQFTGGMGALMDVWAEKNAAAAVASKVLASSEAAINSYLAFTQTLAEVPFPFCIPAAAGVLAAGLAAQIKIFSTPISAETGGRFVVPNVSAGVDGVGLRVNPGEMIDVTPRGEESEMVVTLNLVVDGAVLAQIVNARARAGEIYNLQLARNL